MPRAEEVSVVITTRDRHDLVARALRSAIRQDLRPAEIIVVDDGSKVPWRPPEDADVTVTSIRHDRAQGPGAARNSGISAARGAWIALLDDDDLWAPEKLSHQLGAAAARPDVGLVYASAIKVDPDMRVVQRLPAPDPSELPRLLLAANDIPAGASNVVVRASVLRDVGGFDPSFRHLADWDLWIRLVQRTAAAAVSEELVAYVQHPQNMVSLEPATMFDEWDRLVGKHADFARTQGGRMTPGHLVDWYVSRHELAGRPLAATRAAVEAAVRYRQVGHSLRLMRGVARRRWAHAATGSAPTTAPGPPWLT